MHAWNIREISRNYAQSHDRTLSLHVNDSNALTYQDSSLMVSGTSTLTKLLLCFQFSLFPFSHETSNTYTPWRLPINLCMSIACVAFMKRHWNYTKHENLYGRMIVKQPISEPLVPVKRTHHIERSRPIAIVHRKHKKSSAQRV